jgi:hypothetical protein
LLVLPLLLYTAPPAAFRSPRLKAQLAAAAAHIKPFNIITAAAAAAATALLLVFSTRLTK